VTIARTYQISLKGKTYDEAIDAINAASRKRKEKANAT